MSIDRNHIVGVDEFLNTRFGYQPLVGPPSPSGRETSSHRARFIYTCKCGWIDGDHIAGGRMAGRMYHHLTKNPIFKNPGVRFTVENIAFGFRVPPLNRPITFNSQVSYQLNLPLSQAFLQGTASLKNATHRIDDDLAKKIAQYIAYDLAYEAEETQGSFTGWVNKSVFSFEDLVSDWIGVLSFTLPLRQIVGWCGGVSKENALAVYDEMKLAQRHYLTSDPFFGSQFAPPDERRNYQRLEAIYDKVRGQMKIRSPKNPLSGAILFHLMSPKTKDICKDFKPSIDITKSPPDFYNFYRLNNVIKRLHLFFFMLQL